MRVSWQLYFLSVRGRMDATTETGGMNGLTGLGVLWQSIQSWLFAALEDEIGELDRKHREFIAVCEVCRPQDFIAEEIREMSKRLGHIAIIDHNPRGGEKRPFAPAEAVRYNERSAAERVNSHLKDAHGGRHVRVRGAAKVGCHLAFGIVVIVAEQLVRMLS